MNNEQKNVEDKNEKNILVDSQSFNNKTIGIASDHRGFKMKQKLTKYLSQKGYTVYDYGCDSTNSVDYPLYGFKLGEAVRDKKVASGIAICGSGIGIGIACNKVKGVRCARVSNCADAKWTKRDNNANIIAFSGSIPFFRAKDIVDTYLKTSFLGSEKYMRRIEMLDNYKG